jgi:hypothetical protein
VALAVLIAALRLRVPNVLPLASKEQVRGINACGVIASVANALAIDDRAVMQFIREAVG